MATSIRIKLPSNYKGNHTQDVKTFVTSFEIFCQASSIEVDKRVALIGSFLEEEALSYYTVLIENTPTITWDQFKISFYKVFDLKDQFHLPELELMSRIKLDDEQISSYFISKLTLINKVDRSMSNERKVLHLVSGLPNNVRKSLPLIESLTLDNFLQVVSSIMDNSFSQSGISNFESVVNKPVTKSYSQDDVQNLIKSTIKLTLAEQSSVDGSHDTIAKLDVKPIANIRTKVQCTICNKLGHSFLQCFHNPNRNMYVQPNHYITTVPKQFNSNYRGRNFDPNYKSQFSSVHNSNSCEECGHVNSQNVHSSKSNGARSKNNSHNLN